MYVLVEPIIMDACSNVHCGSNAECINGQCQCLPEYNGDPYFNCRPECVLNTDCDSSKTCIQQKCVDPCLGACGLNAICQVINHIPMCSCNNGFTGNAFVLCNPIKGNVKICKINLIQNIYLFLYIHIYTFIRYSYYNHIF